MVLEQGYKQTEAARSFGVDRSMLGRWIKEAKPADRDAFRGNGKLDEEQQELRRPREESRCFRREFLRKQRPSSRESRTEIPVHCPGEGGLPGDDALPITGRQPWQALRLLAPPGS
ncbi:transposase [Thioalkalicoccus limnaeus]|uniref:transposase n=1 Tax=Thioalkalicoccus limnaeus TaxID=120681 RepID=UPI0034E95751